MALKRLLKKRVVKMGHLMTVRNRDRRFGSARFYVWVKLQDEGGQEEFLAFTPHELKRPRVRARRNPEDRARLLDLFDWID